MSKNIPPSTHTIHPLSDAGLDQYPLTKVTLRRHTFLYNDEAQIVLLEETLNDHLLYVHCTPAEYHLLRQFLNTPYTIIPFEHLGNQLVGRFNYQRDVRTLRRHLSRLKKKLPAPLSIISIRETGYVLCDEERHARKDLGLFQEPSLSSSVSSLMCGQKR